MSLRQIAGRDGLVEALGVLPVLRPLLEAEPGESSDAATTQHQAAQPADDIAPLEGRVIALGWWVQPETADDPDHEPVGTLYLLVDERRPRPMWVSQGDITSVRIED